jgi:hypothetical protein
MSSERRRTRRCPSCDSDSLMRGTRIEGWTIAVSPEGDSSTAAHLPPYADVCRDCGLVCLFVRVAEITEA